MQTQNTVIANNPTATIKLGANDKVHAAPASTSNSEPSSIRARIDQLIAEREAWEQSAYVKSNEQLYALLGKCYGFYLELRGSEYTAVAARKTLDGVISKKGFKFSADTHTITKIVKCVFGVNRRRVSAYSLVLRVALSKKLRADEIAAFIAKSGGVEEVRLSKSPTAKTPAQKAALGMQVVKNNQLAVVASDKLAEKLDNGNVGKNLVAIVTQQADSSLILRELISNQSVLNAALACAYSKNKTAIQQAAADSKPANDDAARHAAIKDAARS